MSASGAPKQLGPAKPKESIEQAQTRIDETLSSGDCDRIAKLNPLSRPALDNPKRCAALKRLASLQTTGAAAYPGGGILDYAVGPRTLAAILVVDSDGRYHITLLDPFVGKSSIGTPFAPQFDAAARKAATALAHRDCDAFLAVASRQIGPGTLNREQVCPLPRNAFSVIGGQFPAAKPKRLGGNADFAFYSYGTPGVNYTLLLARESNEGLPPTLPKIPKSAATYSYLAAYPTNRKEPEGSSTTAAQDTAGG
ncbi:MAG TPA: hypothetical protein VH391_09785 [Solirubrobacterales bacterium]